MRTFFIFLLCISCVQSREDARSRVHQGNMKDAPIPSIGLLLHLKEYKDDEYPKCKYWPEMCTATIISPKHILTNAHCLDGDPTKDEFRFYPGLSENVYGSVPPTNLKKKELWIKTISKEACNKVFNDNGWISKGEDGKKYYKISKVKKAKGYAGYEHYIDYGVATLNKKIADEQLIIEIFPDQQLQVGDMLETAGYPGDKWKRYHLYYSPYKIDEFIEPKEQGPYQLAEYKKVNTLQGSQLLEDNTYYAMGGQSGSPVFIPRVETVSGIWMKKTTKVVHKEKLVALIAGSEDKELTKDAPIWAVRISAKVRDEICNMMKSDGTEHWKKQPSCLNMGQYMFPNYKYSIFGDEGILILVFILMIIGCAFAGIAGCFVGCLGKYLMDQHAIMPNSANSQKV